MTSYLFVIIKFFLKKTKLLSEVKFFQIGLLLFFSTHLYSKEADDNKEMENKEAQDDEEVENKEEDKKEADDKKDEEEKDEDKNSPLEIGNFSLPTSQQPGPFLSFGQNIIDKGDTQFYLFPRATILENGTLVDVFPFIIYGITDAFSFLLTLPFSPWNTSCFSHSSGIEDLTVQFEYAFFVKESKTFTDQATIVANISVPTGSHKKNPPTGLGATGFFLGATFNHTEINWLFFTSPGMLFTTKKEEFNPGEQFYYQFGIGRTIATPPGVIFSWLLELNGIYFWKDRMEGIKNPDSGGNLIILAPSFWFSTKKIIAQLGLFFPIQQNFFGGQAKQSLGLAFDVGVTF